MHLDFEAVSEAHPGARWQGLFNRYWPAYRAWFDNRRTGPLPSIAESTAVIARHMPELLPTYKRLLELAGGNRKAAALLSCHNPPPYLVSCSQAALCRDSGNVLIRNYDLDPALNEGVILHTRWTGREVIATSEFLWGVADGMNDQGLALSLAFGGSEEVGEGFGIPLILRYVLEVANTVEEAIDVLHRIPSHMAYNVTLLDRQGASTTVQLAPGRAPVQGSIAVAANHQGVPQRPAHAAFTRTLERSSSLTRLLADPDTTASSLQQAFMASPLYNTRYSEGFGTLYTMACYPEEGRLEWHWPDHVWTQTFDAFEEGVRPVSYSASGATVEGREQGAPLPTAAPGLYINRGETTDACAQAGPDAPCGDELMKEVYGNVLAQLRPWDSVIPDSVLRAFAVSARTGIAPYGDGQGDSDSHSASRFSDSISPPVFSGAAFSPAPSLQSATL